MSDNIPVVFGTDERFVPYCGVAVQSLIHHTDPKEQYDIFILFDALSYYEQHRLENLSTENVRMRLVCIHDYIKSLQIKEQGHLTVAAAYRLVIPDLFAEYDKVIYLDSDIIVCDDVAKLYAIDIADNLLGASHGYYDSDKNGFVYRHITRTLGLTIGEFFNSGVLIMNLREMIKQGITTRCLALLQERDDLVYMDQCALNLTCRNQVYFIPKRWNEEWGLWRDKAAIDEEAVMRGNNAAVVHYSGPWKPWDYPERFLAEKFWMAARMTVFYEEILRNAQIKNNKMMMELLCMNDMRRIAVYGAGIRGKGYVREALRLYPLIEVVAWVDRNYRSITDSVIPVEPIERLSEKAFDMVVVAIKDDAAVKDARRTLVGMGIPEKKIRHYHIT